MTTDRNEMGLLRMPLERLERWVCSALVAFSCGANAAQIFLVPDCPVASSPVSIIAYEFEPPPTFGPGATVTRTGSAIRVVIPIGGALGGHPPDSREVSLGTLPIGSYRLELVGRIEDGRETALAARDFDVTEATRSCAPASVEFSGKGHHTSSPGQSFPGLEVAVRNTDGQPLQGETVFLGRLAPLEEFDFQPPRPNITLSATSALTGPDGVARFTATAGGSVGSVQYVATVRRPDRQITGFVVLTVRPVSATLPVEPVVEYYHVTFDHYFMTSNPEEMRKLDTSELPGWIRTGQTFLVYPSGSTAGNAVCRYYGLPAAGLDSHFFSASQQECAEVAVKFPQSWLLETNEAFRVALPDPVFGQCAPEAIAVYRIFNQRTDANHRYSPQLQELRFRNSSWISEGYGPNGVVMCSPR